MRRRTSTGAVRSVAWLRRGRVLLPGVTVLALLVAEVQAAAAEQLHQAVTEAAAGADPGLAGLLDALLVVPAGARVSELERLRRAPTRASGPELVRALTRAGEVGALDVAEVDGRRVPATRPRRAVRRPGQRRERRRGGAGLRR